MIYVLLDGKCTMCSWFGIWLAWLDINNVLRFTTQQENRGEKEMKEYKCEHYKMKSIIMCDTEKKVYYTKSTCVLEILKACNYYLYPFVIIGYLIPQFIRDYIYDFISIRRHKLFGTESCKKPPKYYKEKILT